MSARISIGICGTPTKQSEFVVGRGNSLQVDFSDDLSQKTLDLAIRDTEILSEMLKQNPEEMTQILRHVAGGNFDDARKIARGIGFQEKRFIEQGGGLLAVVIIIAIGAALLLEHD